MTYLLFGSGYLSRRRRRGGGRRKEDEDYRIENPGMRYSHSLCAQFSCMNVLDTYGKHSGSGVKHEPAQRDLF
jgi:hypothetical protein